MSAAEQSARTSCEVDPTTKPAWNARAFEVEMELLARSLDFVSAHVRPEPALITDRAGHVERDLVTALGTIRIGLARLRAVANQGHRGMLAFAALTTGAWFVRASNGIVVDSFVGDERGARLWFGRRSNPQWSHTEQLVAWTAEGGAGEPLLGMGTLDAEHQRMRAIDLPVCEHCRVRHASVVPLETGELKYLTSCRVCQKQAFEGL